MAAGFRSRLKASSKGRGRSRGSKGPKTKKWQPAKFSRRKSGHGGSKSLFQHHGQGKSRDGRKGAGKASPPTSLGEPGKGKKKGKRASGQKGYWRNRHTKNGKVSHEFVRFLKK